MSAPENSNRQCNVAFERMLEKSGGFHTAMVDTWYPQKGYGLIAVGVPGHKVWIKVDFVSWKGEGEMKIVQMLRVKVKYGEKGYYAEEAFPA